MNLLEKVSQNGSTLANYVYLSDGTKISATNASGDGLVYLGSFTYKKNGANLAFESAPFGEGQFVATATGFEPHYFLRDHLGSVRAVVADNGEVLERNDYYPFGMRWNGGQLSDNRYRYNGKEEQSFLNLPYSDYGARMYDSRTGRFKGADQLSEKYFSSSPYAYCLNNPINAIDPDGRLVIFINGFTPFKKEQGTENYWRKSYKTMSLDFAGAVMSQLGDHKAIYKHGGNGLKPMGRYVNGYIQALSDAAGIEQQISNKDGDIVETIKIITHSMGGACGKGYVEALQKYFKDKGIKENIITLVADFDPYQAYLFPANPDVYTMQFTHKGIVADYRQNNLADEDYYDNGAKSKHGIMSFIDDISKLQEGTYIWNGSGWVLKKE